VLFVPLVLSVRYATDVKHQETTLESGCILCETGALYQFFGHLPYKTDHFDTKVSEWSVLFLNIEFSPNYVIISQTNLNLSN